MLARELRLVTDMAGDGQKFEFIPRLEALRGVAAVSVVAYHAFAQFVDTNVTGMAPVVLFFVLSGFVLARSLGRNEGPSVFLRHRAFRLFPAAIAVVLLLTALHAMTGFYIGRAADFSAGNVILNALMIRHDINGPMWSMTVECLATPLIYAAFMLGRRQPRWLIPIMLVLFGLSFVGEYAQALGGYINLAPLYAFVLGVWLHFVGWRIVEKIGPSRNLVVAAACAALCFAGLQKQTAPIIAIEAISSGLLVSLIAFEPMARSFRILDNAVVLFYGRISYSFYLLHAIGLIVATQLPTIEGWPIAAGIWTTLVAVAITTPMAWASWRLIEKPFVAIGKSVGERDRRELIRTPGSPY